MSVAVITGSCGLIGCEAVNFFCKLGCDVIGIDNDMRSKFFGRESSTMASRKLLKKNLKNYRHYDIDVRDEKAIKKIFSKYQKDISLIIHTAAQPSHDWAAKEPYIDFSINANATFILLESFRLFCPNAIFIFTSTNKVYGDGPNTLPFVEGEKRYELSGNHRYYNGIDESFGIDNRLHSLFGASKVAADILVQEYGKYFGLKTVVFRGGCFAGSGHLGAELHGFLSYMVKCCITGKKYTIYGYKGKQVRDNLHSYDLVNAFYQFSLNPRMGEIYNIGGGRLSNISILEAIDICEKLSGRKFDYEYTEITRKGDHIWWVTDFSKFKKDYPGWNLTYSIEKIIEDIYRNQKHAINVK